MQTKPPVIQVVGSNHRKPSFRKSSSNKKGIFCFVSKISDSGRVNEIFSHILRMINGIFINHFIKKYTIFNDDTGFASP